MARDDPAQIRDAPILDLPIEPSARSRNAMSIPDDPPTDASATAPGLPIAQPIGRTAPPIPPSAPVPLWVAQTWAWLRARAMLGIGAAGISGASFAFGGGGTTATESDLTKLETTTESEIAKLETSTEEDITKLQEQIAATDRDLSARLTNLEPLVDVVAKALNMSALALEISVESHHYTADLIVDVAKLDHPNYHPPPEDVRLQRRLRKGGDVVDEISRP